MLFDERGRLGLQKNLSRSCVSGRGSGQGNPGHEKPQDTTAYDSSKNNVDDKYRRPDPETTPCLCLHVLLQKWKKILCSKTCAQPCGRPRQRMQCKHAGSEAYVNVPWTSSRRDHRLVVTNRRASDLRRHHIVSLVHFKYARVSDPLRTCLVQASTLNLCACVGVVQVCHNCSHFIEMYF